jgi:hypothetical protein
VGGVVAAPVFVIGSAAGALLAVQAVEREEMARLIGDMAGVAITPDEAWALYLLSLAIAGVLQAIAVVAASTLAGALAGRRLAREG